jgi:hypothetical protein
MKDGAQLTQFQIHSSFIENIRRKKAIKSLDYFNFFKKYIILMNQ